MEIFRTKKRIITGLESVKPDPRLLTDILKEVNVTNWQSQRNPLIGGLIINLLNIMSKNIKILSGGVAVAAVIVVVVFLTGDSPYAPLVKDIPVTQTRVAVAGQVVDVDSLIVDLVAIDVAYDEPIYDDSDLTADLINSNYEIQ